MERRVTTVLAADVAGYSTLMATDEEDVIQRLRTVRANVLEPAVAGFGGRIFKTMGDGLLAEFASPVEAARAALRIHEGMASAEAAVAEDRRLRFRIGINLGDVAVDGDDLLGDAVNVAARLESLAPVGGICVSRSVEERLRGCIEAAMTALGPQAVKNIPHPVEVWRIEVDGAEETPLGAEVRPGISLAVLPFQTRSADTGHDILADGIVEDVTAALGRFGPFFVIARNSAFSHRAGDGEVDLRKVGRSLGVRYIVRGSLRGSGRRIRLAAELVEAGSGTAIWSQHWDRTVEDVFDLQDELVTQLAAAVAPRLVNEEIRVARRSPPDLGAWRRCARALGLYYRFEPESHAAAVVAFGEALALDPEYALARAYLAKALFTQSWLGWSEHPGEDIRRSEVEAREALASDPGLAEGHYALACALFWQGHTAAALRAIDRCVEINPHFADGHLVRSQLLSCLGRFEEAEPPARLAIALSPDDPLRWAFLGNLADALFGAERWEEALEAAHSACEASPDYAWGQLMIAASAARAGRAAEARAALAWLDVRRRAPKAMVEGYPFARWEDRRRLLQALEAAGAPA